MIQDNQINNFDQQILRIFNSMEPENNDILLGKELLAMGFSDTLVHEALHYSKDKEQAIQFIITAMEDMERFGIKHNEPNINTHPPDEEDNSDDYEDYEQNCKMVFLVRMDLKMGLGKMAAQVGHSTIGAYKKISQLAETNEDVEDIHLTWMENGSKKIALKVETEEEIHKIVQIAKAQKVNYYLVHDAGKTQIAAGSLTVCALGPQREEVLNKITGHLKLL